MCGGKEIPLIRPVHGQRIFTRPPPLYSTWLELEILSRAPEPISESGCPDAFLDYPRVATPSVSPHPSSSPLNISSFADQFNLSSQPKDNLNLCSLGQKRRKIHGSDHSRPAQDVERSCRRTKQFSTQNSIFDNYIYHRMAQAIYIIDDS